MSRFQQECHLSATAFNDFIDGRSVPPPSTLQLMARWLFANATFDPGRNLLVAGGNNLNTTPKSTLPSYPLVAPPDLTRLPPAEYSPRPIAEG